LMEQYKDDLFKKESKVKEEMYKLQLEKYENQIRELQDKLSIIASKPTTNTNMNTTNNINLAMHMTPEYVKQRVKEKIANSHYKSKPDDFNDVVEKLLNRDLHDNKIVESDGQDKINLSV